MHVSQINLVPFGPEHLVGAVNLSRQAGWPHRQEDWQMALAVSNGFAAVEDERRVVGTVLVTSYGKDCATINMVIVDEAMRGRGLGRKLMDAALALADDRRLRLVATSDGLPLYQKLGFRETDTVLQHQGRVPVITVPESVETALSTDFDMIAALDRAAFGADRKTLLDYIIKVGQFAVIRRAGQLHGFAALRAFGRGEAIGPVVAANADDARALVSFFIASRPGAFLRVDTTAGTGISTWLTTQGLAHVGGGVAMRTASPDAAILGDPKTFALANQALG